MLWLVPVLFGRTSSLRQQLDVSGGSSNNNIEGTHPVKAESAQKGQEEVEERFRKLTIGSSDERQGMLMPKNRKDKRYSISTLDFYDDDNEALLILLCPAHSQPKTYKLKAISSKIRNKLFLNTVTLIDRLHQLDTSLAIHMVLQ